MATLAELQTQLETIKTARNSGIRSVSDGSGKSVTYASLSEMDGAIARLESEIARVKKSKLNRAQRAYVSDKGY